MTKKNQVSAEVRDVYRSMLQLAHDSTHYEDCWKDHWPCVLEKVLDEVDRLANALSQSVETVKLLSAEHSAPEPKAPLQTPNPEQSQLRIVRRVQVTYEYYDGNSQVGGPELVFNGTLDEAIEDGPTFHFKATAIPMTHVLKSTSPNSGE